MIRMLARLKVSFSGREQVSYVQFKDFIGKLNIITADESVQQLFFDHAVIHIINFLESAMGQARLKVAFAGREYLSYRQFNCFIRKLDIVTLQESVQQLFFDHAKVDIIDFLEALYHEEAATTTGVVATDQTVAVYPSTADSDKQAIAACPTTADTNKAPHTVQGCDPTLDANSCGSCASTAATVAAAPFGPPSEWQARIDRAFDGFINQSLSLDKRLDEAVDCLVPPQHRTDVDKTLADESGVGDMIRELLAKRADPNLVTPMGLTMLESAISSRSAGGVEVLLGARADPRAGLGAAGTRPLQYLEDASEAWPRTASTCRSAIAALLLDALASRPPCETLRSGDCVSVLHPFTLDGDTPVALAIGQTGLVERINDFGDAVVVFRAHGEQRVLRSRYRSAFSLVKSAKGSCVQAAIQMAAG